MDRFGEAFYDATNASHAPATQIEFYGVTCKCRSSASANVMRKPSGTLTQGIQSGIPAFLRSDNGPGLVRLRK
jgi:hypothetical protein